MKGKLKLKWRKVAIDGACLSNFEN